MYSRTKLVIRYAFWTVQNQMRAVFFTGGNRRFNHCSLVIFHYACWLGETEQNASCRYVWRSSLTAPLLFSAPATFFSLTRICALFSCEFSSRLVAYLLGYQVDDLVMVPQTLEITKLKLARVRDNAMLKLLLQVVDVVCTHPCLKNILVQEVWMATFQKVFFFLLSEWVPEPCPVRSDLRQLMSCRPSSDKFGPTGRSTLHQMLSIQILIPLLQSTAACFCLPKGSQPESSMQKKPENLRPESKQFLSFFPPFRSAQWRGYDLRLTLTSLKV